MYDYENNAVKVDCVAKEMFERFQRILPTLLPSSSRFEGIEIDSLEVVLKMKTGNFIIDVALGGIITNIKNVWQIYMSEKQDKQLMAVFYELGNHLHPELQ